MNAVKHQFFDTLRFVGLRDRLRCPSCKAVGTWKPHGGWFDREDVRKVRRWLCKWCGFYEGPERTNQAYVHPGGPWSLDSMHGWTPQGALKQSPIPDTWPWLG